MQTHQQSATRYEYNEKKDFLFQVDRTAHTALEVPCPHCQVNAGHQCRDSGAMLPKLSVHLARQEASL